MKKLVFLFLSLLTAGSLFQACDDSKTYAEMLEDEKNAVSQFIKDSAIHVISVEEFEKNDTVTKAKANGDAYDEFVSFTSEGIYTVDVVMIMVENMRTRTKKKISS